MDDQRVRIQEDLRGIVAGEVRCDDVYLQLFASDASIFQIRPLAVVQPRNTEDVVACIQYAAEHNLPVHARGAGTSLVGQSLGPGLVVDFSRHLRRVLHVSDDAVRVQPGVVLDRLNDHLASSQRLFGPDPATSKVTTMGGMIAVNATGSRWPKYGATRGRLVSLQTVLASGDVVELSCESMGALPAASDDPRGRLIEQLTPILARSTHLIEQCQPRAPVNACGYQLSDVLRDDVIDFPKLLCGSEGTLAIVTEATLRTDPLPARRGLVMLFFDSLEAAARAALELAPLGLTACDLLDRRSLSLARDTEVRYDLLIPARAEAMLLVEVDGDDAPTVRKRLKDVSAAVTGPTGPAVEARIASDMAEMELFWELTRRVVPTLYRLKGSTRPLPFVEDLAIPPDAMPEFVVEIQNILKHHQVTASLFGHAVQGQLHLRPFLDLTSDHDVRVMHELAGDLSRAALAAGGTISGEHGDGLARTRFVQKQYGPLYDVFREIKRIFDPHNLLNPGKIVTSDAAEPLPTTLRPVTLHDPQAGNGTAATVDEPPPGPFVPLQLKWSAEQLAHMARTCNGCGTCRSQGPEVRMCPIFRFEPCEEATPRAKANLMRGVLTGQLPPETVATEDFKAVADLCVNCHMCRLECPAGVDIPSMMAEAKGEYVAVNGLPLRERLLARLDLMGMMGGSIWRLSNWLISNHQTRWLLEKLLGLARERKIPRYAPRSFLKLAARRRLTKSERQAGPKVLYFVDTYANFHDPQLAEAFVAILEHNGVGVFVHPGQLPSGMSMFSAGMIERARRFARHNVGILVEAVRQGYEIVCTEPAAALCLGYEYPLLLGDEESRLVADHTSEACGYLWKLHRQGKLQLDFQPINATLGYHVPCHVKALRNGEPAWNLLRLIPALSARRMADSCSGMAGTFGFKRENFRDSMRAGWPLITNLRHPGLQAGTTECSACKIQMEQGANKPTIHPLKLLALSYGLMPEIASKLTATCDELVVT